VEAYTVPNIVISMGSTDECVFCDEHVAGALTQVLLGETARKSEWLLRTFDWILQPMLVPLSQNNITLCWLQQHLLEKRLGRGVERLVLVRAEELSFTFPAE
jgi:hypothetical protein